MDRFDATDGFNYLRLTQEDTHRDHIAVGVKQHGEYWDDDALWVVIDRDDARNLRDWLTAALADQ